MRSTDQECTAQGSTTTCSQDNATPPPLFLKCLQKEPPCRFISLAMRESQIILQELAHTFMTELDSPLNNERKTATMGLSLVTQSSRQSVHQDFPQCWISSYTIGLRRTSVYTNLLAFEGFGKDPSRWLGESSSTQWECFSPTCSSFQARLSLLALSVLCACKALKAWLATEVSHMKLCACSLSQCQHKTCSPGSS